MRGLKKSCNNGKKKASRKMEFITDCERGGVRVVGEECFSPFSCVGVLFVGFYVGCMFFKACVVGYGFWAVFCLV